MHEPVKRSSPILTVVNARQPGAGPCMGDSARELRAPGPELEKAFEAIYRREDPLALRFARRHLDDAAAEDVVQSGFVRDWEGYTQQPALVFVADSARTRAAILASVRNEMRMVSRRARTF